MRRYDILVTGILLILSVIIDSDFALAAPVLVRGENRQASSCVDVVHILPKGVINALGKRWEEEEDIAELWEPGKYLKTLENPEEPDSESSVTDTSSGSASSETDHDRSTNVVQAPAPNPASSTANPYPLMEPTSPSSAQSLWRGRLNAIWDDVWSYKAKYELHGPLYTPTSSAYASSGYGSDNEFTKAHAPQPNPDPDPNPRLSTDSGLDRPGPRLEQLDEFGGSTTAETSVAG
jgi:hypothetical protein